jgi:hypothetical protein
VVVFPERWKDKEARLAAASPYGHLPGWRLLPCIVKADDDLRQEQFVSQLLAQFAALFRAARVPVWVKAYDILAISASAGLIQCIPDTISLDSLKKNDPHYSSLQAWFEQQYNWGPRGVDRLRVARVNFARSLAAYSIVCYILQIKDRHNGNILVDRRGAFLHPFLLSFLLLRVGPCPFLFLTPLLTTHAPSLPHPLQATLCTLTLASSLPTPRAATLALRQRPSSSRRSLWRCWGAPAAPSSTPTASSACAPSWLPASTAPRSSCWCR